VEVVGRIFNAPITAWSATVMFHLLSRLSGVRDADYFYDRVERVWIVQSHDTYVAVGYRISRLWPWVVHRLVEIKLTDSRDYWYLNRHEPRRGSIIFDVGAGDGVDTILFARSAGPDGRVFAIEAHPKTARLLRATCRHNRLDNVSVIEAAVMGTSGSLAMTDEDNRDGNRIVRGSESMRAGLTTRIEATTIDAICHTYDISHIDLLKMNIEGAELDAIAGMTNAIAKVRRACIACHDFLTSNADEPIKKAITTYMTSNGFEVFTRNDDGRPWARDHVHCVRNS